MKTARTRNAFSLVEVVLALGIASFGLLAVAGLLPVGMGAVKDSREQAAAAKAIEQIYIALRKAAPDADNVYRAGGEFSEIAWKEGEVVSVNPQKYRDISLGGYRTTDAGEQRLTARIEIVPPAGGAPGKALVSVAWPNRATWNDGSERWENASGTLSTWLILMPKL